MIQRTFIALACLTLTSTLLTSAEATVIMIDDFQDGDVNLTANSTIPSSSSSETATSAIGGTRETGITYKSGPLSVRANTALELLSFSSDTMTAGDFNLTYDANGSGLNADLTNGGSNDTLFVDLILADAGSILTVTLQSIDEATSTSNSYSLSESLTGPGLAEFRLTGFIGVNPTDIESIAVNIEGAANGDYAIDQIYVAVPEPSSMIIWSLSGLGLIPFYRRRTR